MPGQRNRITVVVACLQSIIDVLFQIIKGV